MHDEHVRPIVECGHENTEIVDGVEKCEDCGVAIEYVGE